MEESYPMTGGDGPLNYAKNSNPQRREADNAKALLVGTIFESLDIEHICPKSNSFRIADLGCSIGPNTYIAVNNIIEVVTQKYQSKGHTSLPEFQVFFNDHVSNDFNFLYGNLPPERKYFAAGVPGSFYTRLFPKGSIHFIYSAYALQWLSKTPVELGKLSSPSCNKGRIYYSNAPNEVGQAYSTQYAKDIGSFLCARAEELAPAGLMKILIPGRNDGILPAQSSLGPHFEDLESSLLDMTNEVGKTVHYVLYSNFVKIQL
uniref:S-adenosylmethionine-dependent methyltransferase n=1 Tax=Fagus sylvatica TaxID=28930 RepID=A0A2N9H6C9_FAGSY